MEFGHGGIRSCMVMAEFGHDKHSSVSTRSNSRVLAESLSSLVKLSEEKYFTIDTSICEVGVGSTQYLQICEDVSKYLATTVREDVVNNLTKNWSLKRLTELRDCAMGLSANKKRLSNWKTCPTSFTAIRTQSRN